MLLTLSYLFIIFRCGASFQLQHLNNQIVNSLKFKSLSDKSDFVQAPQMISRGLDLVGLFNKLISDEPISLNQLTSNYEPNQKQFVLFYPAFAIKYDNSEEDSNDGDIFTPMVQQYNTHQVKQPNIADDKNDLDTIITFLQDFNRKNLQSEHKNGGDIASEENSYTDDTDSIKIPQSENQQDNNNANENNYTYETNSNKKLQHDNQNSDTKPTEKNNYNDDIDSTEILQDENQGDKQNIITDSVHENYFAQEPFIASQTDNLKTNNNVDATQTINTKPGVNTTSFPEDNGFSFMDFVRNYTNPDNRFSDEEFINQIYNNIGKYVNLEGTTEPPVLVEETTTEKETDDMGFPSRVAILGKPVIVPSTTTEGGRIVFIDDDIESPAQRQCVQDCQTSTEYDPICATNHVTYFNPARFICARNCGFKIFILKKGRCESNVVKKKSFISYE